MNNNNNINNNINMSNNMDRVFNDNLAESRKRRPSGSLSADRGRHHGNGPRQQQRPRSRCDDVMSGINDDAGESSMDECNAALVLMSLSCSPRSPHNVSANWGGRFSASPPINGQQQRQQQQIVAAAAAVGDPSDPSDPSWTRRGGDGDSAAGALSNGGGGGSDEGIASDYATDDGCCGDDSGYRGGRRNGALPRKKRAPSTLVFQCTWPGCGGTDVSRKSMELHVRQVHLGPRLATSHNNQSHHHDRASNTTTTPSSCSPSGSSTASDDFTTGSGNNSGDIYPSPSPSSSSYSSDDHEEEFYYTEIDASRAGRPAPPSPPTLSHRDMARPPHEDPEYQKRLVGSFRQGLLMCKPINIPGSIQHPWANSPQKHVRLSPRPSTSYAPYPTPSSSGGGLLRSSSPNCASSSSLSGNTTAMLSHSAPSRCGPHLSSPTANASATVTVAGGAPLSPSRRAPRGENKKCRKVYGMEHRDQWCTQCKWKKACSRFGD